MPEKIIDEKVQKYIKIRLVYEITYPGDLRDTKKAMMEKYNLETISTENLLDKNIVIFVGKLKKHKNRKIRNLM